MKRIPAFLTAAMLCIAAFAACDRAGKEFTTKIRGEVVDRPESTMLLMTKMYEDSRVNSVEIPITGGRFEYDLVTDTREMYELTFVDEQNSGSWRPMYFFAEPGEVRLTLYPKDRGFRENRIDGPKLNKEYAEYRKKQIAWNDEYSAKMEELMSQGYEPMQITMSSDPDTGKSKIEYIYPDTLSENGRRLHAEFRALEKSVYPGAELRYFRENPTIVSYAFLFGNIKSGLSWSREKARPYMDIYYKMDYPGLYPDHPYTRELERLISALSNIAEGGKYIDFTLPDLDGNTVTVSEHIGGRIALIEMWMTWCGPCRRKAMSAIPVYEEFKDKGFAVVGVSGDSSLDEIREVAKKDGYPWTTLVDIAGAQGVWSKYGITGSGGATYLVDRDGTILAVDPDAEQVRKILLEKL